jgi:hypothetical protein
VAKDSAQSAVSNPSPKRRCAPAAAASTRLAVGDTA